ncbi:MAG: hypothetical protein RLY49_317 [Candidatus Parcubacteria bacterium]|jgi:hypothetical protein
MVNRKELDNIIESNKKENWWKPELFKDEVLELLPRELEIVSLPPEENENYNCFIYTLGLKNNFEIISQTGGFIYSNFFRKLIEDNVFKKVTKPEAGDFILYRNEIAYPGEITHSGIVGENDKIISKWAWGPIIRHNIFDVPESYGDNVEYFKGISGEFAINLFNKYKKFNIN